MSRTPKVHIPITIPFMPPYKEYESYLQQIWSQKWLTNNGPLVQKLEIKLQEFLGLDHLLFVTNGTIALQMAIKTAQLSGEVITTPFSYIATTSSLLWENLDPVFVDIEDERLSIDPAKIEKAITAKTSGIVATHVYGIPGFVEEIEAVAKKHNLIVIYDGAHAFGTTYKSESVFHFGDISTISFHATKLFHTIEGGAVITSRPGWQKTLYHQRNFGHDGPGKFYNVGINGKNSEFHAAMGLVNLNYIDTIIAERKRLFHLYEKHLSDFPISLIKIPEEVGYNYAYIPILFSTVHALKSTIQQLERNGVMPRRYFFPALHRLSFFKQKKLPVAESIAQRILCLPLYMGLEEENIQYIANIFALSLNYKFPELPRSTSI